MILFCPLLYARVVLEKIQSFTHTINRLYFKKVRTCRLESGIFTSLWTMIASRSIKFSTNPALLTSGMLPH